MLQVIPSPFDLDIELMGKIVMPCLAKLLLPLATRGEVKSQIHQIFPDVQVIYLFEL